MTGLAGAGSILGSLAEWPLREAAGIGLAAVAAWVVAGAEAMLAQVLAIIDRASTPSLSVTWFSGRYWVIAGLALALTLPFLFAAAVQAIARADLAMLLRAGLVDLPLAVLAVTLCTPLIQILLAATDAMCALLERGGGASALVGRAVSALTAGHSGFLLLIVAGLMLAGGLAISIELVIRAAAIYAVVLFLPLGFAAMVWPARRVWIRHMLEVLAALILSKFAMVAILSLAGAAVTALATGGSSLTAALTTGALMLLAAFSPWALLRLLPFTELAAAHGTRVHGDLAEAGARARRWAEHPAPSMVGGFALESAVAGFDALGGLLSPREPGAGADTASRPSPGGPGPGGSGPGGSGPGGLGPTDPGPSSESPDPAIGRPEPPALAGSSADRPAGSDGPPVVEPPVLGPVPATPPGLAITAAPDGVGGGGDRGAPGGGPGPAAGAGPEPPAGRDGTEPAAAGAGGGDWLDRLFSPASAGARIDLSGATPGWWTGLDPDDPERDGSVESDGGSR